MKILKLRFSNLNSMYGEWSIDFTDSAYINDGIFAITGPTGSGKTTIMDAICLALYGQTPRLGRISGANDIMSRKTGECFSEVEFESSKGHFRCQWSQKRSYQKPDGKLQSPKHEISDAATGSIIESSKNLVLKRVEDFTGMSFEQFTRAIMLAQGGFAAFLEAKAADRAPILEQITGTGIYSRISAKVFENAKEQRQILENLLAGTESICLLSDAELESLKSEKQEKIKRSDETSDNIRQCEKCLLWLENLKKIKDEITLLEEEKCRISEEEKNHAGDFARLERAERAFGIEGFYRDYITAEKQAEKRREEFKIVSDDISDLRAKIACLLEKNTSADEKFQNLKERLILERELVKEVFELDIKADSEEKQYKSQNERQKALLEKKDSYEHLIEKHQKSLSDTGDRLEEISGYLIKHPQDDKLTGIVEAAKEKISALNETANAAEDKNNSLENLLAGKKDALALFEQKQKAVGLQKEKCRKAKEDIQKYSRELDEISGKETLGNLRDTRDLLQGKISSISYLKEKFQKQKQLFEENKKISDENVKIALDITKTKDLTDSAGRDIETHEKLYMELEEKNRLILMVKSLEEQRADLREGESCPLCGSKTHPYSSGIADAGEKNDEMAQIRKKTESLRITLKESSFHLAELKEGLKRNRIREAEIEEELKSLDLEIKTRLERTGLDPTESKRPGFIEKTEEKLSREFMILEDTLKRAEDIKCRLYEAGETSASEKDALHEAETACISSRNEFESLCKQEEVLHSEIILIKEKLAGQSGLLKSTLESFGEDIKSCKNPEEFSLIIKRLEKRRDVFQEKREEKEELSKRLEILDKEIITAKNCLADAAEDEEDIKARISESKDLLEKYKTKRHLLYEDKDPESEIKMLENLVSSAGEEAEKIKAEMQESEGTLKSKITQKESLEANITRDSAHLTAKEMTFSRKLEEKGFSGTEDFEDSLLSPEEKSSLKALMDEITGRKTENLTMLSDRSKKLAEESEKNLTDKTQEDKTAEKEFFEAENRSLLHDIGVIEEKLRENERQKASLSERLAEVERQKEVCRQKDELNVLIGSKDGKKFRNFAQGLTFEIMISNANRRLEMMSDRYILMHSPDTPLELCVIDNYQAGEVRTTRNLSGGESFIISLALALGLSNMAGRNVRVDSLFLDEGFGTLDEDSLETALDTLSGLRQDGKLIGIISHVDAVRERIPAKIEVFKKTGGKSMIKGPGCTRTA